MAQHSVSLFFCKIQLPTHKNSVLVLLILPEILTFSPTIALRKVLFQIEIPSMKCQNSHSISLKVGKTAFFVKMVHDHEEACHDGIQIAYSYPHIIKLLENLAECNGI